jgi:hypothetical protein
MTLLVSRLIWIDILSDEGEGEEKEERATGGRRAGLGE